MTAKALADLGVDLNKVHTAVEMISGLGDRIVISDISLTPRSKKVIELAADEAHLLNQQAIRTEHLLLGLLREGEGIAIGVLASLGVEPERARETVLMLRQTDRQTDDR